MKYFSLKWSSLHRILSGLIGKSIFIISLAIPLSKCLPLGFNISYYTISLLGAILVAICYILETISIPNIISRFSDMLNYAEYNLFLQKENAFDFFEEFEFINRFHENKNYFMFNEEVLNHLHNIYEYLPIEQGKDILDQERAILFFYF